MHKIERVNSCGGLINWMIKSDVELSDKEICEIVELQYPSPGYGVSRYFKYKKPEDGWFVVSVWSNASCD